MIQTRAFILAACVLATTCARAETAPNAEFVSDYLHTADYYQLHYPEPAQACYWDVPTPVGNLSERDTAPLNIESDSLDILDKSLWKLTGNVVITKADQQLTSNSVLYNKTTNYAEFDTTTQLIDSSGQLNAASGHWFIDDYKGEWIDATFREFTYHVRGGAQRMNVADAFYSELHQASYTTCEPGRDDLWMMYGSEITLDRDTGTGTATNMRLHVFNLPVFYFPYIEFPIDDRRKTGFLYPTYRRADQGMDITVPFYWNIAPNYDLTLYPRHIQFRAAHLGAEGRWLNPYFYTTYYAGYTPYDRVYGGQERWSKRWDLDTSNEYRLQGRIKWQSVSDDDYLDDYDPRLDVISTAHLEQFVSGTYYGSWWNATAKVEDYQTIDSELLESQYPYKKQPELLWNGNPYLDWYDLTLDASAGFTRFEHIDDTTKTQGDRTWGNLVLSYPHTDIAFDLTPTLGLDWAHYSLNRPDTSTLDETQERVTPFAAIDGTVYFERSLNWFKTPLIQTLEPRIFALYVPYRDQQDIPLFDTANVGEKYDSLFEFNRFTGHDRFGDTQQVSLAVSSRFIDQDTGVQYALFQIGQARYLSDHEVQLTGNLVNERRYSNVFSKMELTLPNFMTFTGENAWDPDFEHTDSYSASLKYKPQPDRLINLGYRATGGNSVANDSGTVSVYWPITQKINAIAHWNYSFTDDKMLEKFGGIEIRGCCIAFRGIGRSYFKSGEEDPRHEILLQFELIGLGSFGEDLMSFLESSIEGFQRAN